MSSKSSIVDPAWGQPLGLNHLMRVDWDRRARLNSLFYVNSERRTWLLQEFFESGVQTTREQILNDHVNVYQGKQPGEMNVLEIGCGVGRVTRALADIFSQVYAVDVSGEMISRARQHLRDVSNVHVFENSGSDLDVLGDLDFEFDFAFSCLVFQHVPRRSIIESYVAGVARRIRPGGLFKFQVQGSSSRQRRPDTWCGESVSVEQAREIACRNGFEPRFMRGAGTQDFWLWFFKDSV